jgi:hypothetical protein
LRFLRLVWAKTACWRRLAKTARVVPILFLLRFAHQLASSL